MSDGLRVKAASPLPNTWIATLTNDSIGYVPPASSLERRFEEILARRGMPPMRRQVDLGEEVWCGRVDFVDPHVPLVVEVQSERYHSSLVDRAADAVRRAGLVTAGAEVVEVWDIDVWHRPDHVIGQIDAGRQRLRERVT